jgi:hypothetical protein
MCAHGTPNSEVGEQIKIAWPTCIWIETPNWKVVEGIKITTYELKHKIHTQLKQRT